MSKRVYNILFHLHTVSGIVISVVLYVIFFAGSFSFFRDEIVNWERDHQVDTKIDIQLDFDAALDSLSEKHDLRGRDISISKYYDERRVGINLEASKDSLASDKARAPHFFFLDTKTFETTDYISSYTLGEFLYRLHFLAQIPYPAGYYLSGFTAFFFLFAIITGILVHWKKIVSNFYIFRPWAKLKTLWTDAHTALGTIGFPFQFVYAVTGAFFMIKALLVFPSVMVLYNGDQDRLYEDLEFSEPSFAYEYRELTQSFSINDLASQTRNEWENFNITHLHIFNYGDAGMHVSVEGEASRKASYTGPGKMVYKVVTGEVVSRKEPITETTYLDGAKNVMYRIHYGDYGGYPLKVISFILGLISCFVIISGVMIWLAARDKKNLPEKKRRFNEGVVHIYLAVCLSMYPLTAASFIAVKVFNPAGMSFIYWFYFTGWLLLAVFFILKKDHTFTNRYTLLSGSILGLFIPVVNGLRTGNWIWITFRRGEWDVLVVDLLWILVAAAGLFAYRKICKK